jgi:putative transposase
MKVTRAQVIRLNPTPEQDVYFRKACGVARHAYNWALARWKEYRAQGKWAKMNDLKREYNQIKSQQFPWVYEVTKCAPEQEFTHLGQALANYWRMKKEGTQPQLKHPRKDGECALSGSLSTRRYAPEDDHACGSDLCSRWLGRPQCERDAG